MEITRALAKYSVSIHGFIQVSNRKLCLDNLENFEVKSFEEMAFNIKHALQSDVAENIHNAKAQSNWATSSFNWQEIPH